MIDVVNRKALLKEIECGIKAGNYEEGYEHYGHINDMDDIIEAIRYVDPVKCKDCKRWKDSDGSYRRGVKAESQCPINRKEVFEGNGYCYMFEPQESEDADADCD